MPGLKDGIFNVALMNARIVKQQSVRRGRMKRRKKLQFIKEVDEESSKSLTSDSL